MPSGTDPVLTGERSAHGQLAVRQRTNSSEADAGATMRSSVESILRNQEENGAFVASPDFAEYHYCWLRDGSFVAYALDQVGEHDASARYHEWVNRAIGGISELIDRAIDEHRQGETLDPAHMPPARFALDGSNVVDDWPNFQIDGYGTWLWALGQHLLSTRPARSSRGASWFGRAGRTLSRYVRPQPVFRRLGGERLRAAHLHAGLRLRGPCSRVHACLATTTCSTRRAVRSRARESAIRLGRYVKSTESDDVDASVLWLSTPFRGRGAG